MPPKIHLGQDTPPLLAFADPYFPIMTHANHLPHWQQGSAVQFVTWRLVDSVPLEKLDLWKHEKDIWLKQHPEPWNENTEKAYYEKFVKRLEDWLDAGMGACILRAERNRSIVEDAIMHFNGQRYDIWAFVIMPNHVHALFSLHPDYILQQILHSWKSYTAKALNRHLSKSGAVWQEDYWDRLIRNESHFLRCIRYICNNPKSTRLSAKDYSLYLNEFCIGMMH